MKLRLAAPLQTDSIVDGPGLRAVIWTQGCMHNCLGCHNPSTHDFDGGMEVSTFEVCKELSKLEYTSGITFSGGDPMYQPEACNEIASYAKSIGLNVWCYSGFTYEELLMFAKTNEAYHDFLSNIDVLVDGKFILEKRNLGLLFRGSENQRLIEVQKSLRCGRVILLDEDLYKEKNYERKEVMYI